MTRQQLDDAIWEQRVSMYRLAVSILRHPQNAEDAVSSAILQAYRQVDSIRHVEKFKPWIMHVTANCCYDFLRREKREQAQRWQLTETEECFALPEDSLFSMLERLPSQLSQVLVLYYYEHFSIAEIARTLRLAAPTVRMRLTRGRRQLRDLLEEEEGEE